MNSEKPRLLISNSAGKVYDVPFFEATGMKGGEYFRLDTASLVKLPRDSELFMLPARKPVGYDPDSGRYVCLDNDPFSTDDKPCWAVAAFLAPGYTTAFSVSYKEKKQAKLLPLFSYAAVAFIKAIFTRQE